MSYIPSILPEKKESFLGHFVRAVAAINLQTFESACHNVRYKIDYHMIHARLKYYSNSKNPRVIHTKLDNQKLFSLRTNPHDPYLLRPGEFLTLGSAGDEYNAETLDGLLNYYYSPGSFDVESCPPVVGETENSPQDLLDETSGPVNLKGIYRAASRNSNLSFPEVPNRSIAGSILNDPKLIRTGSPSTAGANPVSFSVESCAGPQRSRCKRLSRRPIHTSAIQEEEVEYSGTVVQSALESLIPRYIPSSYSSPGTLASAVPKDRIDKRRGGISSISCTGFGSPLEADSCFRHYAQYSNLLSPISPLEPATSYHQKNSNSPKSPVRGYGENRVEDKKVWQVVLSDISLSAARLSTGSEGTSRDDYDDLKGDLTHAKIRSPDYFAENLKQGKAKFYGNLCSDSEVKGFI